MLNKTKLYKLLEITMGYPFLTHTERDIKAFVLLYTKKQGILLKLRILC